MSSKKTKEANLLEGSLFLFDHHVKFLLSDAEFFNDCTIPFNINFH
jgi:hypothetical protein